MTELAIKNSPAVIALAYWAIAAVDEMSEKDDVNATLLLLYAADAGGKTR